MNFEEMALNRQSTRKFDTSREVEKEKLIKICDIARLAPSACNSQPWKLHVLAKDSPNVDAVRKACQVVGLNKFLNDVNSYIVIEQVFGNRSASLGSHFGNNDLNSIDIGILSSYICFAAMQEGLGTCMLGAFRSNVMLKAMGFDKKQKVRLVIAVGYAAADDIIRKKVRKDLDKVMVIEE